MAGEVVYADLNLPSEPHTSALLHHFQQRTARQNSSWYKISFLAGCIGNIILVATVVALALQLEAKTDAATFSGFCATKSNSSLEDYQSHLKRELCNQTQGNSSVNSNCRLCPGHWELHRDECYWKSQQLKTWNQSRDDCLRKNAELLVIQDKEEMDFIKQYTQDIITYWIGLEFSVKKWMWVNGTQLDQKLFEEPEYPPNKKCGAVKIKILSEDCSTEFKWICKKKSVTLSF